MKLFPKFIWIIEYVQFGSFHDESPWIPIEVTLVLNCDDSILSAEPYESGEITLRSF